MKILFISYYTGMYGANTSLLLLMKDLKRRYNVTPIVLMPTKGEFTEKLQEENIDVIISKYYRWMCEPANRFSNIKIIIKKLFNILLYKKVYRVLKDENIDLIHSNSSISDVGDYLASKLGVSHLWHIREYGKEDYNIEYMYSLDYVSAKYARADCVVAISNSIKEYYSKVLPNSNHINFSIIYNGVSIPELIKVKFNIKSPVQFCVIGLVSENKNQKEIIEACKCLVYNNVSDFKLNIIGDGESEYVDYLKNLVSKYSLNNYIDFWGYRKNIDDILQEMDIGIMASKKEAFGRVTVEYMSYYMPVIGANTGGTVELINNSNGYLYESGDYKQLADIMKNFIYNRNLIEKLGKQARSYANDNFRKELTTDNIYKEYCKILKLNK